MNGMTIELCNNYSVLKIIVYITFFYLKCNDHVSEYYKDIFEYV